MFERRIVVDCRGHMFGRLASVVAKELLNGQRIVLVRAEELLVSGSLRRNLMKFERFLLKKVRTNPARGPFHYRSPSKMIWRAIRGMIPHKKHRGEQAMRRLKIFEGIPAPYDKVKRVVIPNALRVLRVQMHRHTTVLGNISTKVGWTHYPTIKKLEEKRKTKSTAFYLRKKALLKIRAAAVKQTEGKTKIHSDFLTANGY